MGRVDGIRGYHDIKRYPNARLVPGLILFRWDAPLFFPNAALFKEELLQQVEASPTPPKRIILAAEPMTSVDVTSADMLIELKQRLNEMNVELHIAEMKDPVKDKMKQFELLPILGDDIFFPTIGAAVDHYLESHQVDWRK
jgi:MFS superfamily sulfate permease-like transporter